MSYGPGTSCVGVGAVRNTRTRYWENEMPRTPLHSCAMLLILLALPVAVRAQTTCTGSLTYTP